jgi:hypothetical protein
MGSRQDTKSCVAAAFPGSVSLIERAYRKNGSFRDLCRDYRKCAEALEGWRRSEDQASSSRSREYAELLNELSREIASWLEAMENGSTPPGRGVPR